jgi:hypothetical protein
MNVAFLVDHGDFGDFPFGEALLNSELGLPFHEHEVHSI